MSRRGRRGHAAAIPLLAVAAAGWLLATAPAAAQTSQLTPQEERGRQIYRQGTSPSGGEIVAVLSEAGTEVPAAVMPCAGCHGRDGRGRPEGGLSPSNLTWPVLTKPYGVDHPSGRQHPPYDVPRLKKAITLGSDPAGNRLHVAMPRYRMSHQDLDDLAAYVQRLGTDPDPGVAAGAVTLATFLPQEGPMASVGAAMEAALTAYFAELTAAGGIYHRRVDLRVLPAPADAAERAATVRRALEDGEVFALVAGFLPGAEAEVTAVVEDLETPLVGPFTLYPQIDLLLNPYVFYLLPGLDDLGRALVAWAGRQGPRRAALFVGSGAGFADAADAVVDRAAELGWPPVARLSLADVGAGVDPGVDPGVDVDAVFLLAAGDEQAAFLRAAAARGWYPQVLLPGVLLTRDAFAAPAGFAGRLFAAFPTVPSHQTPESVEKYRRLAAAHRLPPQHLAAQMAALGAAEVLVEGMKRAGRELSRARLIAELEGLSELDTGLLPPLTFGPNRRVGLRGAYVAQVDLERQTLVPVSDWIPAR